ncbi:nuclear receptor subfamily 2 group F member 1-B-like [Apis florea]|uniref:nuclear receptor subfamily 2 group F member 1-B-like n=1 Tax=Apis florea TaxID=7463 RepID=UPI0012FEEC84|nr:nuclear receptor subfamily 2 group F member 1-B-like [Apis florea]
MGGTWTAGLQGPSRVGLAERQGPVGAYWQARLQACIGGQMNQQCKVCGEPAAGFHFGAFTCEGCKVRGVFNHRLNAYCKLVYHV